MFHSPILSRQAGDYCLCGKRRGGNSSSVAFFFFFAYVGWADDLDTHRKQLLVHYAMLYTRAAHIDMAASRN